LPCRPDVRDDAERGQARNREPRRRQLGLASRGIEEQLAVDGSLRERSGGSDRRRATATAEECREHEGPTYRANTDDEAHHFDTATDPGERCAGDGRSSCNHALDTIRLKDEQENIELRLGQQVEPERRDERLGEQRGRQRRLRVLPEAIMRARSAGTSSAEVSGTWARTLNGNRRGSEANGAYLTSTLSVPSAAYGGGLGRGP
jgi:hypothetical protein